MRVLMLIVMLLVSGAAVPTVAGPLEDGIAAYDKGDYATALRLLRPLAEQGNASAQNNLGFMYGAGWGVPQDYATAVSWYRKAAEQGYGLGQHNLGAMYFNGQGVLQDYVQAHMWFNLSAVQGDANAATHRDVVAMKMTPAQLAEAQKLGHWHRPERR